MSLIKHRPEIKLFAPRVIVAGTPFSARVVLECEHAVPIDEIEVELLGTGVWYSTSQYGQHRNTLPFSRWVAHPVKSRRELSPGTHELSVSFELPRDIPTSYGGRTLSVEWTIRVNVDIPWWPDARATFAVHVSSPPPDDETPPPRRVFASSSRGPSPRKPYAEVSLGTTTVHSGGRLHGRVAFANTSTNQYQALRLALVAVETVPGLLSSWSQHNQVARWVVSLDSPAEDAPIDFALSLPTGLVPGFATRKLSIEWFLEVRVDVAWSLDTKLWIPITVVGQRAEGAGEMAAPLAVGSQRLALVWREAARQSGYNYADGELTREIGICRLVVRREHQGRRGLRLVGEALFRDVDLGLRISELTPQLIPALEAAGLEVYHAYGRPDDGYQLTLRSRYLYLPGTSLDLFFFYEQDDTLWHAAYWRGHQLRYRYRRFELEPRRFLGLDVWVPAPPEDYLVAKYGEQWSVPNPHWHSMFAPKSLDLQAASETVRKAARPWH